MDLVHDTRLGGRTRQKPLALYRRPKPAFTEIRGCPPRSTPRALDDVGPFRSLLHNASKRCAMGPPASPDYVDLLSHADPPTELNSERSAVSFARNRVQLCQLVER